MLRRATINDLEEIIKFTRPYHTESFWGQSNYSEARTRERFTHYLTDCDTFVVDIGGIRAMGTLVFDYFFSDDLVCDLEFYYVGKEFRGTGVSRLLRDALTDFAKLKGAVIMCACGSSGFDDGLWVNLWRKLNFKKLGTTMVKVL